MSTKKTLAVSAVVVVMIACTTQIAHAETAAQAQAIASAQQSAQQAVTQAQTAQNAATTAEALAQQNSSNAQLDQTAATDAQTAGQAENEAYQAENAVAQAAQAAGDTNTYQLATQAALQAAQAEQAAAAAQQQWTNAEGIANGVTPANSNTAAPAAPAAQVSPTAVAPTAGTPGGALLNPLQATSLSQLLSEILTGFVVPIGSVFLTVMLVYVGFLFVSAQGNAEKVSQARGALLWTIVGGLLLLGASALALVITSTATSL